MVKRSLIFAGVLALNLTLLGVIPITARQNDAPPRPARPDNSTSSQPPTPGSGKSEGNPPQPESRPQQSEPTVSQRGTAELPVVVRVAVPDLDTSKFATSPPTPEPQPRSRPRKSREAPPTPPTYFTTQTSKPSGDTCGSIAERRRNVRRGLVFVTDASGVELGEGRKIDKSGVLWTARQILRAHLPAKRGPGPDHSPIVYPRVGWR